MFTYEILIGKYIKLIVKLKLNLTGVLCFSNSGTPAILSKKKGYPFGYPFSLSLTFVKRSPYER